MSDIPSMRQERSELLNRQEKILRDMPSTAAELRNVSPAARAELSKIDADIDLLEERIANEEKMLSRMKSLAAPVAEQSLQGRSAEVQGHALTPDDGSSGKYNSGPEYRKAFLGMVRHKDPGIVARHLQSRGLDSSTTTGGGYLIPEEWHPEIIKAATELNGIRRISRVVNASGNYNISSIGKAEAFWTGEGEKARKDTMLKASNSNLKAHGATCHIVLSNSLLSDTAYPLEKEIKLAAGDALAQLEESSFTDGDGNKKPTGFLRDATEANTSRYADAITQDDLIDLKKELNPSYLQRASWVMHPHTLAAIEKMEEDSGRKILNAQLQNRVIQTLYGMPVVLSSAMPILGAGRGAIALGNFDYYYIVDRQEMTWLVDPYGEAGLADETWFYLRTRVDAKLVLPDAIKVMKAGTAKKP